MKFSIRRARQVDVELLSKLAAETFWEAYQGYPEILDTDLRIYVDEAFRSDVIAEMLARSSSVVFVADIDSEPVGYALLNIAPRRPTVWGNQPSELERLYTKNSVWGTGVGQGLLDVCIRKATGSGCDWMWLSVWEFNARALSFYRRNEFEVAGGESFQLGSYLSNDLLMKKRISIELQS